MVKRTLLGFAASLAFVAGCSHPPPSIRVEPSAYFTHGYYIGSSSNVKVFVESLTFVEDQRGTVAIEVAILNERPEQIRFLAGQNFLVVGERRLNSLDSQGFVIRPGELVRTTVQFRTDQTELSRATLELDGIEVAPGTRLRFDVPMYAADPEAPEPKPLARGGLKRS